MLCIRKFDLNIDLFYIVELLCVWFDVFVDFVVKNYVWIYILVNLIYVYYLYVYIKGILFFLIKKYKIIFLYSNYVNIFINIVFYEMIL